MKIQITSGYLAAIFALMVITGELHEQVHINTGFLLCGGYGERDFNVWLTAQNCASEWLFLAAAAGPMFSYLVMWTGAILLLKAKAKIYQAIGFSLVFAPLPFARIFTALLGGGDEKVVFLRLFQDYFSVQSAKIFAAVFVTAICLPPIFIARSKLRNRFAFFYIIGFCVLPLIVLGLYMRLFLNYLLANGVLASADFLGTPTLVLIHFLLTAIVLFFFRRRLLDINQINFS